MSDQEHAQRDVMQAPHSFVTFVEQPVDVLAIVTLGDALRRVADRITNETDAGVCGPTATR